MRRSTGLGLIGPRPNYSKNQHRSDCLSINLYLRGSQPVARGPLVAREAHLRGPRALTEIQRMLCMSEMSSQYPNPNPVFLNLFGARNPQNFVKRFRTTYRIRLIQSNNKVKHNVACYRCIRVKRKLTVINRLIFINRNVAHNEKRT